MKKVINFLLGDKVHLYLLVISGAFFVHKGLYSLAFLELVLIIMLLIKNNK